MSNTDITLPSAAESDDAREKIRGRIPKGAWGYVRGQYELAKRTYEDIGNEFNCTPSAVFYVVKQARDREIEATLERPAEEIMKAATAGERVNDDFSWASRKVREVTVPKQPSQVELMAQQASAWLTNETCQRLFDATSNTIVSFVGYEASPDDGSKKMVKDAIHEARRALASLELKMEMIPASTAQNQNQRLPELV